MRAFLQALAFFTRIPVPSSVPAPEGDERSLAAAFGPLVGWLVGGWGALVYAASSLALPPGPSAALALAATVWLTGALHEDGLADFCDGFGAGGGRERVLAVMSDSHAGVYAVVGVVLIMLLRWSTLDAVGERAGVAVVAATLVAGHALSRFLCVSLMHTQDYARPDREARGRRLSAPMGRGAFALAALTGVAPVAVLWWLGFPAAMLAVAPALVMRIWIARATAQVLGGYTGDCLGAVQQATLAAFYLGVAASL